MEEILQIVEEILQDASNTTTLLEGIAPQAKEVAQQPTLLEVDTLVNENNAILVDGTFGLAALQGQVAALAAATSSALADIQAAVVALGTPQQAGAPVTLPASAPPGYGTDAGTIWAYNVGTWEGYDMGTLLSFAGSFAYNTGLTQVIPFVQNPLWGWNVGLQAPQLPDTGTLPTLDPALHVAGNSLVDDLNAQNAGWSFSWFGAANGFVNIDSSPGGGALVIPLITGWQWDAWINFLYTPASGPPQRSTMGDTNQILSLIPLQY